MRRSTQTTPPERPRLTCSRVEAKQRLQTQIDRGNELLSGVADIRDESTLEAVDSEYDTWYEFNCRLLKHICTTKDLFEEYPPAGLMVMTTDDLQFPKRIQNLATLLKRCVRGLESTSNQLDLIDEPEGEGIPAARDADASQHVFIIHGRDYRAALELRDLIAECFPGLTPMLLGQEAWQGRTVIETFEEEASKCGFAFAVFTPDDNVQTADGNYLQMRPNVVFELGWFYGRIGRRHTCILYREGTEIPSDLGGLGWHRFGSSVKEAYYEIEKELKAAYGGNLK